MSPNADLYPTFQALAQRFFSFRFALFESPLLEPLNPRVAADENHDWSSVGILKGPSIRRPWKCLVRAHSACAPRLGS